MNPNIKSRWLAALRSGDFPQGQHRLCDSEGNFCCLGVLSELAAQDGVVSKTRSGDSVRYGTGWVMPPASVLNWAELEGSHADNVVGDLMNINDTGSSFAVIANVIETQL